MRTRLAPPELVCEALEAELRFSGALSPLVLEGAVNAAARAGIRTLKGTGERAGAKRRGRRRDRAGKRDRLSHRGTTPRKSRPGYRRRDEGLERGGGRLPRIDPRSSSPSRTPQAPSPVTTRPPLAKHGRWRTARPEPRPPGRARRRSPAPARAPRRAAGGSCPARPTRARRCCAGSRCPSERVARLPAGGRAPARARRARAWRRCRRARGARSWRMQLERHGARRCARDARGRARRPSAYSSTPSSASFLELQQRAGRESRASARSASAPSRPRRAAAPARRRRRGAAPRRPAGRELRGSPPAPRMLLVIGSIAPHGISSETAEGEAVDLEPRASPTRVGSPTGVSTPASPSMSTVTARRLGAAELVPGER